MKSVDGGWIVLIRASVVLLRYHVMEISGFGLEKLLEPRFGR